MAVLLLAAISRGQQVLRPSGPQGQIRVSVGCPPVQRAWLLAWEARNAATSWRTLPRCTVA